jgi:hypothetical protein
MTAPLFDRTPQLAKLRTDLQMATTNAEQTGVSVQDVILALLQRAEDLCEVHPDVDLTRIGQFFAGDGE